MAIKDFVLPTKEVSLPDGSTFAVRGLSLQDITLLVAEYGPTMEQFFQKYSGNPNIPALAVGMELIREAPMLVAHLIALAADEPDAKVSVLRFPLTVQQEGLERIIELTFDANGGPGKFVEAVKKLARGLSGLSNQPR